MNNCARILENRAQFFEAATILRLCAKYDEAIRLFLKCPYQQNKDNPAIDNAIQCLAEWKNLAYVKVIVDYLLGNFDGIPKVFLV